MAVEDPFDPERTSQLGFLCVKSMLLTGFDAPVEQVMYLDRTMQGPELLQAIARVNRTSAGKTHGLVVDYFGLADKLAEALAVYVGGEVAGRLDPREPTSYRSSKGATAASSSTSVTSGSPILRDQVEDALQALEDPRVRARFRVLLDQFLSSLDTVLPRAAALPYLNDAKLLAAIGQHARNRLARPAAVAVRSRAQDRRTDRQTPECPGCLEQDRARLDSRRGIQPTTSSRRPSARAAASEMEHALRYHITVNEASDPVHYRSLADRLEGILERFAGHWDELAAELRVLIAEVRED
jgi:type I restriction enzyme, R subunit